MLDFFCKDGTDQETYIASAPRGQATAIAEASKAAVTNDLSGLDEQKIAQGPLFYCHSYCAVLLQALQR